MPITTQTREFQHHVQPILQFKHKPHIQPPSPAPLHHAISPTAISSLLCRCHELRVPSFTTVKPLSPARSNQITAGASPPQASSPRRRRQAQPWISINHAVTQAALRRARAPLLSLSKKPRLQRRLLAVVSPLSSCCHHPQLAKAAAAPTSTPASAPSSISMLKRKKPEEI